MLDWLDGRNGSSFKDVAYSGGRLTFSVVTNPKARGLEAMLPAQSGSGPLSGLTRGGQPVVRDTRTVKGVEYLVFKAGRRRLHGHLRQRHRGAGDHAASTPRRTPTATRPSRGRPTSPSTSRVDYGRTTALGSQASDTARVTDHSVELTGLSPSTTYRYRVTSADAAGNSASSPAAAQAPASFTRRPARSWTTARPSSRAGAQSNTYVGASGAGTDGEAQLQPDGRRGVRRRRAAQRAGACSRGARAAREDRRRRARRGRRLHLHDPDLRGSAGDRVQRHFRPVTTRPSASATT